MLLVLLNCNHRKGFSALGAYIVEPLTLVQKLLGRLPRHQRVKNTGNAKSAKETNRVNSW